MTPHRKFRCTSTVLILYALWIQWKILVAPEVPMPYTSSIELSTVASHREHVKGAAAESSAPDVPVAIGARRQSNDVSTSGKLISNLFGTGKSNAHRSNALDQLRHLSEGSRQHQGIVLGEPPSAGVRRRWNATRLEKSESLEVK